MMHDYYGDENVLNTLTFKTEGSKSTVLTASRGLGINDDEAQFMADMIPFERGASWSLRDCFEGNEEKGRAPLTQFINEVSKYDELKEVMFLTEGLICGRSIHASASYVFDNGFLVQNSKMRAPNGTYITAYNMADSDEQGGLKIDTLTVENLDKEHKTLDLLIEQGLIEDKGSLKATYDTYLHPNVIDFKTKEMWDLVGENRLIDAFQFDSSMGAIAAKKTKPHSILELAVANSLMRLLPQEGATESPLDTYCKYKKDIRMWYNEMERFGLSGEEIKVLEKHLKPLYGVADSQEAVMQLSMDRAISGFDIVWANKLRKSIAKLFGVLNGNIHYYE